MHNFFLEGHFWFWLLESLLTLKIFIFWTDDDIFLEEILVFNLAFFLLFVLFLSLTRLVGLLHWLALPLQLHCDSGLLLSQKLGFSLLLFPFLVEIMIFLLCENYMIVDGVDLIRKNLLLGLGTFKFYLELLRKVHFDSLLFNIFATLLF